MSKGGGAFVLCCRTGGPTDGPTATVGRWSGFKLIPLLTPPQSMFFGSKEAADKEAVMKLLGGG